MTTYCYEVSGDTLANITEESQLKKLYKKCQMHIQNEPHIKHFIEMFDINFVKIILDSKMNNFDKAFESFKDIVLVSEQANVSLKKAMTALDKNNNDIVDAIMELTLPVKKFVPSKQWNSEEWMKILFCNG